MSFEPFQIDITCFAHSNHGMFGHGCLTYMTVQVVGPSVRVFGMCMDADATVVCKP